METIQILRRAVLDFYEDDALTLAAALAFYTALALAPLVLIVMKIAGLLDPDAQSHVIDQIAAITGGPAAQAVEGVVEAAQRDQASGRLAALLGVATLAFSATGVFGQLQSSLNRIWDVKTRPGLGLLPVLRKRLLSFGMVLTIAFLLLVSLIISAALSALFARDTLLWNALNSAASFALFTALFALMFRYLPDVQIQWRDAWRGGVVTSALFSVGKFGIGLYIGRSAVSSTYGAAGSLVVLLLWVYYSGLVFFLGAEITEAYARATGAPLLPDATAEVVSDSAD
jgi:membrane protein